MGKVLLHVLGCNCGVDPAVFDLDGDAVFKVHDHGVVEGVAGFEREFFRKQIAGLVALQFVQLAAVFVTAGADFLGDAFDFHQSGLVLVLRDIGACALYPRQDLVGGQFAHGAVDGHA